MAENPVLADPAPEQMSKCPLCHKLLLRAPGLGSPGVSSPKPRSLGCVRTCVVRGESWGLTHLQGKDEHTWCPDWGRTQRPLQIKARKHPGAYSLLRTAVGLVTGQPPNWQAEEEAKPHRLRGPYCPLCHSAGGHLPSDRAWQGSRRDMLARLTGRQHEG